MIILVVGIGIMWIELSKRKILQVLETSLSCFGPFGVWGVTHTHQKKVCKLKRKKKTGSHKYKKTQFFLLNGSFPRCIHKARVPGKRRTNDKD